MFTDRPTGGAQSHTLPALFLIIKFWFVYLGGVIKRTSGRGRICISHMCAGGSKSALHVGGCRSWLADYQLALWARAGCACMHVSVCAPAINYCNAPMIYQTSCKYRNAAESNESEKLKRALVLGYHIIRRYSCWCQSRPGDCPCFCENLYSSLSLFLPLMLLATPVSTLSSMSVWRCIHSLLHWCKHSSAMAIGVIISFLCNWFCSLMPVRCRRDKTRLRKTLWKAWILELTTMWIVIQRYYLQFCRKKYCCYSLHYMQGNF